MVSKVGLHKSSKGGVNVLMKHKLLVICLFIMVVVLLLITSVFMLCKGFLFPQNAASITGNAVDNDYNNLLAGGNLVRIGDKLYFNYHKNNYVYGLVEISSEGSQRICWDGPKWFGSNIYNHPISRHNGALLMMPEFQVQFYSQSSGAFFAYEPLSALSERNLLFQAYNSFVIYLNEEGTSSLCISNTGDVEVLVEENVVAFYAVENEIYYYQAKDTATPGAFWKYNTVDNTDVSVYGLEDISSVYHLMIEEDYLVFDGSQQVPAAGSIYSVYKIDLRHPDPGVEIVYAEDPDYSEVNYEIRCWNVYDDKVYIASPRGLKAFDLFTNEEMWHCDISAEECYIVDDLWVYVVDTDGRLWRVPQSGGTIENVFG